MFIKSFWTLFRNVGYLFIIQVIAYLVFTFPDQADDFVHAIIENPFDFYFLKIVIFLFVWSYITWYSSSIVLSISPTDIEILADVKVEKFSRFMGFVPYLILAIVFVQGAWAYADENFYVALIIAAIYLACGALTLLLYRYLDKQPIEQGKKKYWPKHYEVFHHQYNEHNEPRTISFKVEIEFIKSYEHVLFYFRTLGIIYALMLLAFCFPSFLIPISQSLKPAAVLCLSLSFITYLVTVLFYFHDVKNRPFVILIVLMMLVFGTWNDNSDIPTLTDLKNDYRLTPKQAFNKWVNVKYAAWQMDSTKKNDTMPVFFIATQGGGIRGENWTIESLHELETLYPGFYEQTFCIGGASGGTVGALFYTAFYDEKCNKKSKNLKLSYCNFQQFARVDCISPVTASFAFGENLQRFLPFAWSQLDRSKVVMKAFSNAYADNLGSGLLDSSFLKLHYPKGDSSQYNCHIPSLFINGTLAETGQRIITSNLKIKGIWNFKDDIDFFSDMQADISIATAALNCMRFPYLISGGRMYREKKCNKIGHVVDGGYRENTGLQAMYNLISELKDSLANNKRIKPIVIYIRNGNKEYKDSADSKALRFLHDLASPISAGLNVSGTMTPALAQMQAIEQHIKNNNCLNLEYYELWLRNPHFHTKVNFPLGLYMSQNAIDTLRARASEIKRLDVGLVGGVGRFF